MAKSTSMKTLLLGTITVLIVAVAVFGARSTLTDKDELRAHLKSRFAAWTGGELLIEGDTRVSIFPRTRIDVDDVSIGNLPQMAAFERVEIKSMRAEFGVLSLLLGEPHISRLTLYAPTIALRKSDSATRSKSPATEPTLVRALRQAPFSRLTIEQGQLNRTGGAKNDAFESIQANITISQAGAVALEGAFSWRDQTVTYGLESEPPQPDTKTPSVPVRMTIDGDLVSAVVDGVARLGIDFQLDGTLGLTMADTRKFAQWLGVAIPEGSGLGPFTAAGDFSCVGGRIAYDNGTFELDGNRAIGALAVLFDKPTPVIDGTLALQTLNLDPYLTSPATDEASRSHDSGDPDIGFPLLQRIDLDLRLSATQLRAAPIEAGQTALTLSAKGGQLSADVSILDLLDGRASGRIELDVGQDMPRLHVSAALSEIASRSLIETLSGADSPLEGNADIQLDVTGYGHKLGQWLDRLAGSFEIAMSEGVLDIDLPKVIAETRQGELQGWPAVRGSATQVEQFKALLALEGGSAHSEQFAFRTATDGLTGHGTIDISAKRVDWRLELPQPEQIASNDGAEPAATSTQSLHIYGPWSEPTFRLVEKRAERGAPIKQRSGAVLPARAF